MCNTSRELDCAHKCKILTDYMQKLRASGYSAGLRADILQAAVVTFRRKERAEVLGVQPVHRLRGFNALERRREKLSGKRDWFRTKQGHWKAKLRRKEEELAKTQEREQGQDTSSPDGLEQGPRLTESRGGAGKALKQGQKPEVGLVGQQQQQHKEKRTNPAGRIEGVLFVPHSPGSVLARKLQAAEDSFASLHQIGRVKVVERGGARLQDLLGRKDPWARSHCGKG